MARHSPGPATCWQTHTSHTAVADQAQAMVEWMDNFFGDPSYDLEKAESYLRIEFENDWEQDQGSDQSLRLRGKVQLHKISQRVDLLWGYDAGAGNAAPFNDYMAQVYASSEEIEEKLRGLGYMR